MSPKRRQVSIVTGRRQGPALRLITIVGWLLAGVGAWGADGWLRWVGLGAVTMVIAAPILRVLWLMRRWGQEGDWRFVGIGTALLAVIAAGALVAVLL